MARRYKFSSAKNETRSWPFDFSQDERLTDEFEVNKIAGFDHVNNLYKVSWEGCDESEDSWEPRGNLCCNNKLIDFWAPLIITMCENFTRNHPKQQSSSVPDQESSTGFGRSPKGARRRPSTNKKSVPTYIHPRNIESVVLSSNSSSEVESGSEEEFNIPYIIEIDEQKGEDLVSYESELDQDSEVENGDSVPLKHRLRSSKKTKQHCSLSDPSRKQRKNLCPDTPPRSSTASKDLVPLTPPDSPVVNQPCDALLPDLDIDAIFNSLFGTMPSPVNTSICTAGKSMPLLTHKLVRPIGCKQQPQIGKGSVQRKLTYTQTRKQQVRRGGKRICDLNKLKRMTDGFQGRATRARKRGVNKKHSGSASESRRVNYGNQHVKKPPHHGGNKETRSSSPEMYEGFTSDDSLSSTAAQHSHENRSLPRARTWQSERVGRITKKLKSTI